MTDESSSLIALYSALIQGGAAIVVVLGAFIFSSIAARRVAGDVSPLDLERADKEADAVIARVDKSIEGSSALTAEHENLSRLLLAGKVSPSEFQSTLISLRNQKDEIQKEQDRLALELEQVRTKSRSTYTTRIRALSLTMDAASGALAILWLITFCIVLPAIALASLPHDTVPRLRSYVVVLAYAVAILKILDLAPLLADAESAAKFAEKVKSFNRLVDGVLRFCFIAFIVMTLIPLNDLVQRISNPTEQHFAPVPGPPTLLGTPET